MRATLPVELEDSRAGTLMMTDRSPVERFGKSPTLVHECLSVMWLFLSSLPGSDLVVHVVQESQAEVRGGHPYSRQVANQLRLHSKRLVHGPGSSSAPRTRLQGPETEKSVHSNWSRDPSTQGLRQKGLVWR